MTTLQSLRERLSPLPEGRCLLALSGGADSVALTYLLLPLRDSGAIRLEAAHVNHGLRGAASDGDEAFVREMCEREGIPLHTARADLQGRRDENTARTARYDALFRIMKEHGIPTLILAHQQDDQAETFLLRLLRGAGAEGLGGMRPKETRDGFLLLRPMLRIPGGDLREALREAGLSWREDGSNGKGVYLRNRIRLELIPLMDQLIPGAAGRIARAAELIGLENDATAAHAAAVLEACSTPEGLDAERLRAEPEAIRTRILRLWWRKEGPKLEERELNYAQTCRLEQLLDAPRGTIINLPGGWRARREKTRLRLMDPSNRTKNNRQKAAKRSKHD